MSHELNDKILPANEAAESHEGPNLLSLHESERRQPSAEDISRTLEANEKAREEVMKRVADIAARCAALGACGAPEHLETMKEWAKRGAAAGEPAYVELDKKLSR